MSASEYPPQTANLEFMAAQAERMYDVSAYDFSSLALRHGVHSIEAMQARSTLDRVRRWSKAIDEPAPAQIVLDAFTAGAVSSRMFAGELAVHYATDRTLPVTLVARTLHSLLFDEAYGVARNAEVGMTMLQAEALTLGPYDELTWHCLQASPPSHPRPVA
jgi:hypothetical protein